MSIIERIYNLSEFKGDSIYKLSKSLGVSNGYFAKQRQSNGSVSSNILEKIVSYYADVNIEWLITGKGNMLKDKMDSPNLESISDEGFLDKLMFYITKINKRIDAIEQIKHIGLNLSVDFEGYAQLIRDVRGFVDTTLKDLNNNTIALLEGVKSVDEVKKDILENTIKCDYFISTLTEELFTVINDVYKHSKN